jgi:hypothetical protein
MKEKEFTGWPLRRAPGEGWRVSLNRIATIGRSRKK